MNQRLIALLLIALCLIAPRPATAQDQSTDTITAQYTVAAARDWQSTRLIVYTGDKVTIKYLSGLWRSAPDEAMHGPDGGRSYTCYGSQCVEPLPGYPKAALVGRLGDDSLPFRVGNYVSFTAQEEGMLQLRINDIGVYDAEGSVTMLITISWQPTYMRQGLAIP